MTLKTLRNVNTSHVACLKIENRFHFNFENVVWNVNQMENTNAASFGATLSHNAHFTGFPKCIVSMCFFNRYLFINDALHIVQ